MRATTTTFGAAEHAQQAIGIVRAVHGRIAGTAPRGRTYRADESCSVSEFRRRRVC
ncbi:oxygenase MpaB family protein [Nesterenkonia sp. NBAIMH1]|uniref:oxygenase MpaB family protein n=1 Tax=Nesterenkonia sp. NBAIMH1 TaxID=2600320 RepID=UPI00352E1F7F